MITILVLLSSAYAFRLPKIPSKEALNKLPREFSNLSRAVVTEILQPKYSEHREDSEKSEESEIQEIIETSADLHELEIPAMLEMLEKPEKSEHSRMKVNPVPFAMSLGAFSKAFMSGLQSDSEEPSVCVKSFERLYVYIDLLTGNILDCLVANKSECEKINKQVELIIRGSSGLYSDCMIEDLEEELASLKNEKGWKEFMTRYFENEEELIRKYHFLKQAVATYDVEGAGEIAGEMFRILFDFDLSKK